MMIKLVTVLINCMHALKQLVKDDDSGGIVIHIPSHDGRGFGTAPKAETEIYKRGGRVGFIQQLL